MATNITNSFVAKLKAQEKPFEVWDEKVTGLVLRVQPTGAMTYYVAYSKHSRDAAGKRTRSQKRIKIGPASLFSPDQARDRARDVLADHYRGEDPAESRKRAAVEERERTERAERERHDQAKRAIAENYLHFLEAVYKPWLLLNLSHGEYAFDTLKKGFPELHGLRLSEITPGVIEKWRTRRQLEGISKSTLNRQLSDLRACLNRACDVFGVLEANPLEKLKPYKTDSNAKIRYLTAEEEKRLLTALDEREEAIRAGRESGNQWREQRGYAAYTDLRQQVFADHLKPAVLLSLHTGLRRGELFKLRWDNVDVRQKQLTVVGTTSKTGKTRHVQLNERALQVLRDWKDQPGVKGAYVFTAPDGEPFEEMRTAWENALARAAIKNFRWHDLRHTFASKLVMAGVDLNTVRDLLGHADYKMTLRYAHLAPEHKAAAVAKLVSGR
ncbi:MAG: site-specific integrase [Candidatus Obscuribacterales bacterium]